MQLVLLLQSLSGGSNELLMFLQWDPANKKLEIGIPSGGVTGIIADGQDITQGSNTAVISMVVSKVVCIYCLNKDSIEFAAADVNSDTNSNCCCY